MLKLGRIDWRALQWTEDDASEQVQLEFFFARMRPIRLSKAKNGLTRLASPTTTTTSAKHS
jgi:hypothetical protein